MRTRHHAPGACLGLMLATACGAPAEESVAFCSAELGYDYAPDEALTTFPDDWWTIEDATTGTGLRIDIDPDHPAVSDFPDEYDNLIADLGTLDGFGLTPELRLTFTRSLPDDLSAPVLLTESSEGTWTEHALSWHTIDFGRTLLVRPWRPLPPGVRGVLAVPSAQPDGDCIAPSPVLKEQLTDPDARLHDRYTAGLDALGWTADEVGAMTVFTTQSADLQEAAIREDIASRDITLDAPMDCQEESEWWLCEGTVTVADYRADDGVVPADEPIAVREEYALPVSLWLPHGGEAPYPVLMCGHGITGSRSQCSFAARLAAPIGIAVLAVDAQEHGDHPDRTQHEDGLNEIMALCGFTMAPPSFDALLLRDNFRASAWDRLQVLAAVDAGFDVDGDGTADLDPAQVQYAGASLGGIMGPQLMAGAPQVSAGVLIVPGGGLMDLFIQSDSFGIIATAMTPADWDEDDLAGVVPMLQTLIDAGDPLVFAAELSRARETAEQADVALLMAYEDAVVPNISTTRLAQAFAVETVGEPLVEIPGVSVVDGAVEGNLPDGATGGLLQLAQVQPDAGSAWETAEHGSVHSSVQGEDVLVPFMLSVLAGEAPLISAPVVE